MRCALAVFLVFLVLEFSLAQEGPSSIPAAPSTPSLETTTQRLERLQSELTDLKALSLSLRAGLGRQSKQITSLEANLKQLEDRLTASEETSRALEESSKRSSAAQETLTAEQESLRISLDESERELTGLNQSYLAYKEAAEARSRRVVLEARIAELVAILGLIGFGLSLAR